VFYVIFDCCTIVFQNIDVGEELRVGLSESYALLMGVKTLKQSSKSIFKYILHSTHCIITFTLRYC